MNARLSCALGLVLSACAAKSTEDVGPALFVLPYAVGQSFSCQMSFDDPRSHFGLFEHSVDFSMAIGTPVTAARAGRVVFVEQRHADDDSTAGHENVVIVAHEDGTYSRYVHLTGGGALVASDAEVGPGEALGLSGNSGSTGSPHLHFDVVRNADQRDVTTIPFAFRNVSPPAVVLQKGTVYTALPY